MQELECGKVPVFLVVSGKVRKTNSESASDRCLTVKNSRPYTHVADRFSGVDRLQSATAADLEATLEGQFCGRVCPQDAVGFRIISAMQGTLDEHR